MAQRWTKKKLAELAIEVRTELGLRPDQRLDPYLLAEEYGIPVYRLDELRELGCSPEAIDYFTRLRPGCWSAALVSCGTGLFIVENTSHSPCRRRSNLAHEMAHVLLEHQFQRILFTDGGCRYHDAASKKIEQDATDLAGELLIPTQAAKRAALARLTDEEVAEHFDVSIELARWRMNTTGARIIAKRAANKRSRV